jgi:sugar lactone lactonase YvrE
MTLRGTLRFTFHVSRFAISAILAILAFHVCALAVTTTVWEQSSQNDFSDGKPKDVSIASENEVALSRALVPIDGDMSELRIWCLARDSKGNMYAGTGDKGKILKITGEGEVSLLFDSPETDIFCLIVDGDDNIYAGTSPDGLVYKIKPDHVPETFFNSGEKYVWSLAFDKAGNLYAGTGITGKLYKITPDGKGEEVYDSSDTHIKCVLSSGDNIYAGSEGSGIIYRISSDGKVSVLYDTSEREICCLAVDAHGNLYAAAASGEAGPSREPTGQGPSGPPGPGREREERESVIYQITPDEVVTRIWKSPDPLMFSMMADGEKLIVGTGDEGRIYSVTPDAPGLSEGWASVADCEESQVLSLYKVSDSGEIWLATGNSGKLYKLSSDYVKVGTLESQERDASVTSKWGNISWDAVQAEGTNITLSTRSGNTEKPDNTWSEWSNEYTDPAGEAIASPAARFIQWRAKLTSADGVATPVLKRVSVAYLQRNLRPSVRSVVIAAEQQERGEVPPRRPSDRGSREEGQGEPEKVPLRGKKDIKWQASDPNDDSLEYTIYFRGAEEKNWKLLEKELKGTSHPLDSESFPDGTYLIKVVATDSPSNPKDLALSHEETSDPFDIDNTPPKVTELQTVQAGDGRYVLTGKVEDTASYVKEILYSIDGGDWKPVFPSDQIFDSKAENFSFPTEALAEGEHTIVIKASDAAGNIGAAKTIIPAE